MTYPLGLHYRLLSALRQQLHRQAMCLVLRLEYQRFSVPTDQLISYAFLKSTKTVTGFLNNVNVYCLSQNMMTAPRAQNVLLLVVSLISLCFQFVHADQARDRLNQFFNQVTTLEAEFQQVVFDENGSQIQRSSGHVKLFRPGRFRWEYITPSKQLILADGQSLWVYDVELEQASVKPMDESLGAAPIALLTELAPLENDFDINEAPIRANLEWVRLTPKLQDTEFHRVDIGFAGKDIRQMELHDQFGQKTVIILSDLKTNIPMQPSQFRFDVPPGVDVIGGEQ